MDLEPVDPEFVEAAKPLALYLAGLHLNDPIHRYVLADLYDIVNEVRDDNVKMARKAIQQISGRPDFATSAIGRSKLLRLQRAIERCEGTENA